MPSKPERSQKPNRHTCMRSCLVAEQDRLAPSGVGSAAIRLCVLLAANGAVSAFIQPHLGRRGVWCAQFFGSMACLSCCSPPLVVTTTANGARFMQNFLARPAARSSARQTSGRGAWLTDHPNLYITGCAFSFTLLGILLIHEFGHYFACRPTAFAPLCPGSCQPPRSAVRPVQSFKIRSRIPSRNALMDVGIYGPLAGYLASVVRRRRGLCDQLPLVRQCARRPRSLRQRTADNSYPPCTAAALGPSIPSFENIAPHPVLVAGWIGLFITSLNLIPGGQLDGGHILYAISPRVHKIFTNLLPFVLFLAGAVFWVGWILWGLFLLMPAMRHPQVPVESSLSRGRLALGVIGIVIFLLTFTPTPFEDNSLMHFLDVDPFSVAPH